MSFFPKTEMRRFNYKPRYYDEHKDRIAQSRERVRKQLAEERGEKYDGTARTRDLHGAFRDSLDRTRAGKRQKMVTGILIGAFLLVFMVFARYAF